VTVGLAAITLLGGCSPPAVPAGPVLAIRPSSRGPGAAPARDLVAWSEPSTGPDPVEAFLAGASRTVDLNVYELDDPAIVRLLAARDAAGVRVRVLLDRSREAQRNRPAVTALAAAGVDVRWAPAQLGVDHAKYVCADGRGCLILTGNLVPDPGATRDFVVRDADPADVAAVTAAFRDDAGGRRVRPSAGSGDLVWSPGADGALLGVIDGARHTLVVENEEMASGEVRGALVGDAHRGVAVTVVMTCDASDRAVLRGLARAGVSVRCPSGPRSLFIHAKAMVADHATAYVGSINFSRASMGYNRELGIVTTARSVVTTVAATMTADASVARALRG
jgi:phosphatidylserine/phosphatidylglycerophosphate/cardiolipin synthase-like enzyme